MTRRNTSSHPLTILQRAILRFIESKGPVTAEKVREGVMREHPLKDSSVRTLLRRLEARGLVSHTVEGKGFIYTAGVPSQHVAASAVRQIIQRLCAGSVERLLVGMVDENVLTVDELERLVRKVRRRT